MAAALPHGVYTALVTPITQAGEVDFNALKMLVEWQRQHGVKGIVVCGTTGEGASLSVEERERAIAGVRECAGDLKVIAGTGCANLPETIHLSRFAQKEGCDAVLVIPPFYYKHVSDEGLVAYYMRLLDAVEIAVLLYNYPELAGVSLSPELVEALLDYPHMVGLKDSSGEWDTLLTFLLRFPRLQVFTGAEDIMVDALASGASGCISGLASALPELLVSLDTAWRRGEYPTTLNERLVRVLEAVDAFPFIPAVKQLCAWRGMPSMFVRPPLRELNAQQAAALRTALRSLQVL